MKSLIKLWRLIRWHGCFVILDPEDGTVTLSKRLYQHMDAHTENLKEVFTFAVPGTQCFGYCCNPVENGYLLAEDKAAVSPVQFNGASKSIGFNPECPTVHQIISTYGLSIDVCTKLQVIPTKVGAVKCYYICRP